MSVDLALPPPVDVHPRPCPRPRPSLPHVRDKKPPAPAPWLEPEEADQVLQMIQDASVVRGTSLDALPPNSSIGKPGSPPSIVTNSSTMHPEHAPRAHAQSDSVRHPLATHSSSRCAPHQRRPRSCLAAPAPPAYPACHPLLSSTPQSPSQTLPESGHLDSAAVSRRYMVPLRTRGSGCRRGKRLPPAARGIDDWWFRGDPHMHTGRRNDIFFDRRSGQVVYFPSGPETDLRNGSYHGDETWSGLLWSFIPGSGSWLSPSPSPSAHTHLSPPQLQATSVLPNYLTNLWKGTPPPDKTEQKDGLVGFWGALPLLGQVISRSVLSTMVHSTSGPHPTHDPWLLERLLGALSVLGGVPSPDFAEAEATQAVTPTSKRGKGEADEFSAAAHSEESAYPPMPAILITPPDAPGVRPSDVLPPCPDESNNDLGLLTAPLPH